MLTRLDLINLIFFFVAACQVSCVITNEIGFEDEANHPLTVIRFDPVEPLQTIDVAADDDVIFSMIVWDPDETDKEDIRARLYISRESDSTEGEHVVRNCLPTGGQDPTSEAGIDEFFLDESNGTLSEVICSENPYYIVLDSPVGSLVSVRMEISDLGYTGETPAEGAYTADVTWLFRVVNLN